MPRGIPTVRSAVARSDLPSIFEFAELDMEFNRRPFGSLFHLDIVSSLQFESLPSSFRLSCGFQTHSLIGTTSGSHGLHFFLLCFSVFSLMALAIRGNRMWNGVTMGGPKGNARIMLIQDSAFCSSSVY